MNTPNQDFSAIQASIAMRDTQRWVMRDENNVIYFLNGRRYLGGHDFNAGAELFGTYDEAWEKVRGCLVGVAFALGPDGTGRYWQEIIISDVAMQFPGATAWLPAGYIEICSHGKGIHGIGYGRRFDTSRDHRGGIEACAESGFFIFSGCAMRDETLTCLADFAERNVKAYHARLGGSIG